MGWREVLRRLHVMPEALLDMSPAERIALAREILPAGMVVARDVPEITFYPRDAASVREKRAWNACRAAMMEVE